MRFQSNRAAVLIGKGGGFSLFCSPCSPQRKAIWRQWEGSHLQAKERVITRNRTCQCLERGLWETKFLLFKSLSLYNILTSFLSCIPQKKVTEGPPSRKSLPAKGSVDYTSGPYISYLRPTMIILNSRSSPLRDTALFIHCEATTHTPSMVFNSAVVTDAATWWELHSSTSQQTSLRRWKCPQCALSHIAAASVKQTINLWNLLENWILICLTLIHLNLNSHVQLVATIW